MVGTARVLPKLRFSKSTRGAHEQRDSYGEEIRLVSPACWWSSTMSPKWSCATETISDAAAVRQRCTSLPQKKLRLSRTPSQSMQRQVPIPVLKSKLDSWQLGAQAGSCAAVAASSGGEGAQHQWTSNADVSLLYKHLWLVVMHSCCAKARMY